jgi:hypothetical protein
VLELAGNVLYQLHPDIEAAVRELYLLPLAYFLRCRLPLSTLPVCVVEYHPDTPFLLERRFRNRFRVHLHHPVFGRLLMGRFSARPSRAS